jgi:glyoxylase-like metal-dependent hydrolase (beta-lactamase superfamily II)
VNYRVTALNYGSQNYPGPAVFYFGKWMEWIYLEFFFWLVQSDEHTILVDVGMSQEHADEANPFITKFVGEEAEIKVFKDPLDALAEHGVKPEDVDYVILTHTHLDHICNVAKYPRATFITSKRGFEWVRNPPYASLVNPVATPKHAMDFLADTASAEGRLRLTEDREEVLPGITTVRTSGHAFDHQYVLIDTEKGRVGLIVDNAPLYANLETNTPVGSPLDVVAALDALKAIAAEADIVVPGHDPDVLVRHPGGRIA